MRRTGWLLFLGFTLACSSESNPEDSEGSEGKDGGSKNTPGRDASIGSHGDDGGTGHAQPADDDDALPDDDERQTDASVGQPGTMPNTGADGGIMNGACEEDSDCVLSQTTPAGCAEGECREGSCHFLARDGDRDGYRSRRCQSLIVGVEVETGEDCEDADATVNPDGWDGPEGDGNADGCNDSIDQDCNGIIDDGQLENQATCLCMPQDTEPCATTPTGQAIDFPILDEDGRPAGECRLGSRECAPNGTWGPCTDAIAPVSETCDELDNDCDSLVDEEAVDRATWFCDQDSDEHLLDGAEGYLQCKAPEEPVCPGTWRADPGLFDDCDDLNGDNFPDNPERCDGEDQDCDGLIDEVGIVEDQLKTGYYCDEDNDGHLAASAEEVRACVEPMGCVGTWLANPLPSSFDDCDDASANRFPGNTEICDEIDNDCDNLIDEMGTTENGLQTSYYCDVDGDSHLAAGAVGTSGCSAPTTGCAGDWIQNPAQSLFDDCDDAAPNRFPGNAETCDGIDNDCDNLIDEVGTAENALKTDYYCDVDGDGHLVSVAMGTLACAPPAGCAGSWLSNPLPAIFDDCDDTSANRFPSNAEICDEIDNDCDTLIDEVGTNENALQGTFYQDTDGDGFGATASEVTACTQPGPAWIDVGGDCQDNVATNANAAVIYPGRPEVCNGRDDDCDTQTDAADSDFVGPPNGTGATYTCQGASGWQIAGCSGSLLHCDTNIDNGCETDGTALSDCHACANSCSFSCGASDCDEVQRLDGGRAHTCGLTETGTLVCFGDNIYGQVGDMSTNDRQSPTLVSSGLVASKISAGTYHSCAIADPSSTLYCWGRDANGQLGATETSTTSSTPIEVDGVPPALTLTNVTDVAAGDAHTCAVYGGGLVACWGKGDSGQVGDGGGSTARNVPNPVDAFRGADYDPLDGGVALALGQDHSCLLNSSNAVECWGSNQYGQIGAGLATGAGQGVDSSRPVTGLSNVSMISAGGLHTCALSGGTVSCWGDNGYKQVGVSGTGPFNVPQALPYTGVKAVAAGGTFTCIINSSDQVQCWGSNVSGERGDSTVGSTQMPTTLPSPLTNVASISAGNAHVCAITQGGQAYCWGSHSDGQLGNGAASSTTAQPIPQLLAPL